MGFVVEKVTSTWTWWGDTEAQRWFHKGRQSTEGSHTHIPAECGCMPAYTWDVIPFVPFSAPEVQKQMAEIKPPDHVLACWEVSLLAHIMFYSDSNMWFCYMWCCVSLTVFSFSCCDSWLVNKLDWAAEIRPNKSPEHNLCSLNITILLHRSHMCLCDNTMSSHSILTSAPSDEATTASYHGLGTNWCESHSSHCSAVTVVQT